MSFDLHTFIAAPSQELLNLAKKSLLDIAAHYKLTTIYKAMLKHEIKSFWFSIWLIRNYVIPLLCLLFSLHRQVYKYESLEFRS